MDVDIELDAEPREVIVPAELAEALDREPDARRGLCRRPGGDRLVASIAARSY